MSAHDWSTDPQAAARRLNVVNADAQARLSFAVECVNGLHYLVDLDEHLVPIDAATNVLDHNWQGVDIAHVRGASTNPIPPLDPCAGGPGPPIWRYQARGRGPIGGSGSAQPLGAASTSPRAAEPMDFGGQG